MSNPTVSWRSWRVRAVAEMLVSDIMAASDSAVLEFLSGVHAVALAAEFPDQAADIARAAYAAGKARSFELADDAAAALGRVL